MPVDVWNIHVQILQELKNNWGCDIPVGLTATSGRLYTLDDNASIAIFQQLIVEMRDWMFARGFQNKPLIISEYGVLLPPEYGYTVDRVNAYMNASFDYLLSATNVNRGYPADENRLVQRWLWYSLNDEPWNNDTGDGFNGGLFDYRYPTYPGVITPFGINFREYTDTILYGPPVILNLQQGVNGYTGAEDTYLYKYDPDRNYCSSGQLRVGLTQQYVSLLHFDLSAIPSGANVLEARLEIYANGWGGADATIELYRVLRNTSMCQATWNVAQTGNAWAIPGCGDTTTDRAAVPEGSVTTSGVNRWYSYNVLNLVQNWVNGTWPNNGVLLRTDTNTAAQFYFASAQDGTPALCPKLIIKYRSSVATPTPTQTPTSTPTATPTPAPGIRAKSDIDGDVKTDMVIFRPGSATWFALLSSTNFNTSFAKSWGATGDTPISGDLDGDRKMDLIVYRPTYGVWFGLRSTENYNAATYFVKGWGATGDTPLSGDLDGDGKMDLVIFRPSVNAWFVLKSSNNYDPAGYFGKAWGAEGDVPISGDLDGDGKMDLIVYRPSYGVWFGLRSTENYDPATYFVKGWGAPGDVPIGGGDLDADGKMDLIVYRPSVNVWFGLLSSTNYSSSVGYAWGSTGDTPVGGGDLDGDRKMDLVVYRPTVGVWFALLSTNSYDANNCLARSLGQSGDVPVQ